ncbi:hypothetical protein BKA58DRAFT_220104 [Alternaria rosae]|uniref:uncharacterized protein n=1 Tax=Alternaria rosae TaxID=1187941 RepID=UPI001E8CA45C|nr:uncharacterized protein BKA58DRAFT_220104 [Alternaria rosae]KAH6865363.1 hypothetical protein BKA58DRAFT_220104 [Alternaria rosae]
MGSSSLASHHRRDTPYLSELTLLQRRYFCHMRLLNTSTLEAQEFLESRVPEYVILSHIWREEEVTLQDLLSGKAPARKGYAKLTGCCKKAKVDGFAYC